MLRSKRAMWATVVLLAVAVAGGGWAASQRVLDGRTPASDSAANQNAAGRPTSGAFNPSSAALGWPNLFGPSFNSVSTEQGINPVWSESGPPVVWRASVGEGYSSPIAEGNDVVVFHRPIKAAGEPAPDDLHAGEANHGPDEVLTCWDAETGELRWEFRHPTSYRCQTHYSSGPYSTPILARDHVYACGTEGNLYCLHRADGTPAWQRELWKDFGRQQEGYFPVTGSPLLVGDRLILNLGSRRRRGDRRHRRGHRRNALASDRPRGKLRDALCRDDSRARVCVCLHGRAWLRSIRSRARCIGRSSSGPITRRW